MTSPQPPQKDFLALTHGQEWVTFYESFDRLVQDHLSRSSELLRRAMSLPEVADREVAQVRDDLESRLAAERERTNGLLTDLKTQISNSHRLASTLAMSIGSLMTDLHSLNMRVEEAIQASGPTLPASPPAPASPPIVPTGLLSAPPASAPAFAAAAPAAASWSGTASGTGSLLAPPIDQTMSPSPEAAPVDPTSADPIGADPAAFSTGATAGLADDPVMDVADLAEGAGATDEAPIDLTAIAEAEETSSDGAPEMVSAASAAQPAESAPAEGETEASAENGERQRPHWLSVTRVGASRP